MPKLAKWNFCYIQRNVDSVVSSLVRVRARERLQHLILIPVSKCVCVCVFMCYLCVCMCVFGISHRGTNIQRMDSAECYTQEAVVCSFSTKNNCFFFIFWIFFLDNLFMYWMILWVVCVSVVKNWEFKYYSFLNISSNCLNLVEMYIAQTVCTQQ